MSGEALSLVYETCVRTRSLLASCRACVDACPTTAISLEGPRASVKVELSKCTACGLCQAECPTDSFRGAFEVAGFLAAAGATVRCGEAGLSCVGALSTEDLVLQALKVGMLTVEARRCESEDPGHALAARRVAQASAWLTAIGAKATVAFVPGPAIEPRAPAQAPPPEPSHGRRQLLRLLVPMRATLPPLTVPAKLDRELVRNPPATARRKRLLASAGSSFEAPATRVPTATIGFSSSKSLDEPTCTGCLLCVNVCPTGALTTPRLPEQIRFDASRCVKCQACHEVCEPRALTLAPHFAVADFFELQPRTLVRLKLQACGECGVLFKDHGGEVSCPRCRQLDEEARELQGGTS